LKTQVKIQQRHRNDSKEAQVYLEVYIDEEGRLVFSPLTKNTESVFKEISPEEGLFSVYCG
jgi:hypothetical protein